MKKQLQSKINDQEVEITHLKKFILINKLNEINRDFMITKQTKNYKYLVLSGGGIKGISFIGGLLELDELGILYDENKKLKIKGIAASSAGTIIAALLSIGYFPKEIHDIMGTLDFEKIVDDKTGYLRDTVNFLSHYGVCRGDYVHKLIGEFIENKTGNADYTIKQLYLDTGIKLVITATNMNTKNTVYLHPENKFSEYSNIPIRTAVRMSMSIPFLFEPYSYNNCLFSDGGVLDNYPLHCFDSPDPSSLETRYGDATPNKKTLGLKITSHEPDTEKKPLQINHLYDYVYSYVDTFLAENDRKTYLKENWNRTVFIITKSYPLTQFSLTEDEKNELIDNGRQYVKKYFA
jgi:NTE family protein